MLNALSRIRQGEWPGSIKNNRKQDPFGTLSTGPAQG